MDKRVFIAYSDKNIPLFYDMGTKSIFRYPIMITQDYAAGQSSATVIIICKNSNKICGICKVAVRRLRVTTWQPVRLPCIREKEYWNNVTVTGLEECEVRCQ